MVRSIKIKTVNIKLMRYILIIIMRISIIVKLIIIKRNLFTHDPCRNQIPTEHGNGAGALRHRGG